MYGTRPIATSTTSASIVSTAPPAAGSTLAFRVLPDVSIAGDLGREFECHALLGQDALELLADFGIHAGQDAVEEFDDDDLRAEAAPHRAELQPDHAGADHEKLRRHLRERERAGRRHDARLVDLDALQARDIRAGRDDDVLRLDGLRLAVRAGHLDLAGRDDLAAADERVDLVLLEQERNAVDVAGDALVLELHHCRQVERRP